MASRHIRGLHEPDRRRSWFFVTLACGILALGAMSCATGQGAPSPINIVIVVENIQPAGVTPAFLARVGYTSSAGAISAAQIFVDNVDVTACAQVYAEGIVYEHSLELAEGAHTIFVGVVDETGAQGSSQRTFVVQPYFGREGLKLRVGLTGDLNTTARINNTSDDIRDATETPVSDVDSSLGATANMRLAGLVSQNVGVDIGASFSASTERVTLGDIRGGLLAGSVQANAGRSTVDYSEFTVRGLSARETVLVGPHSGGALMTAPANRDWEVFALRTDSGVSGGIGGQERFDRYAIGGRHGFAFGNTTAAVTAARVWDTGAATPTPGTFATPQSSTTVGMVVSSALAGQPGVADLAGEIAWSGFETNSDTGGTDSGLAYNFQVAGQRDKLGWSARAFDVPTDFYTLGNPFLATGHRGAEAGVSTILSNGLSANLTYSNREEAFLVGSDPMVAPLPGTDVTDWALNLAWGDGIQKPALSFGGAWGDRSNGASDDQGIDQSERTLSLGLTKAWKRTSVSLAWADYSLSDALSGAACVDNEQWTLSGQHIVGKYALGATLNRNKSQIGQVSSVKSRLYDFTVTGPLFMDRLFFSAGYAVAKNQSGVGNFNAEDEEIRLRLQYRPPKPDSLWETLLASLALEARILYHQDPATATGRDRRSEIYLVASTPF